MSFSAGQLNEYGVLKKVALRRPAQSFLSDAKIDAEWRDLNYHSRPDLAAADVEYQAFEALLRATGTEIVTLPDDQSLTLDSIYTRDALVVTPKGIIKPRMGKPQRRMESEINGSALKTHGIPVIGSIAGAGKLEGGDLVWIDSHTVLVGIGYRTNTEGARQLQALVGSDVSVISFDLPHYKGPSDVFHLMSVLSPIDQDLAVVYRPLMPVRLVTFLEERSIRFVDVPDEEFASMGCNVLAIAPRTVVMVDGNPQTEKRLVAAGAQVHPYRGQEISRKGEGGPTCLTRPLVRG
jgi:N-dimethylarginine dimethylaminohydrolase